LLGAALSGGAIYFARDLVHLHRYGVAADAVVVDAKNQHRVTYDPDGGGIRTHDSYTGMLEFTPQGGDAVRFKANFSSRHAVGDQVGILYDPADPTDACITGWFPWFLPGVLGFLGVFCLLYAFGFTQDGPEVRNNNEWTLFRWFD